MQFAFCLVASWIQSGVDDGVFKRMIFAEAFEINNDWSAIACLKLVYICELITVSQQ